MNDFRYAIRQLLKNPGFTVVAVMTLALGIGANTAIFSLIKALLLQPVPLKEVDRIAIIWENQLEQGWQRQGPLGLNYLDWREQNRSFEELAILEHGTGTVTGLGEPQQVPAMRVSANF